MLRKEALVVLFEERTTYKPFQYPWAYEAYKAQHSMHWIPDEITFEEDKRDWDKKLSEPEKDFLTQIFRFFTQGDVDVANAYVDNFLPVFKHPELRMMMLSFGAMEAVHIDAYSQLMDTVGMADSEYSAFLEYEEMAAKHDYIQTVVSDDQKAFIDYGIYTHEDQDKIASIKTKAKQIAVFSAFTEGLQLFSSFVMLLNFPRHGTMKGMGKVIEWSVRDETLHVESMIRLFQEIIREYPEIWTDDFKGELYQVARDMVELEDKFIDLAFAQGDMEGLTADEVKLFIRHIADRRLLQLGLKPNYGVKDNPLPWYDEMLNAITHTNFFEARVSEYNKGTLQGEWEND